MFQVPKRQGPTTTGRHAEIQTICSLGPANRSEFFGHLVNKGGVVRDAIPGEFLAVALLCDYN